MADHLSRLENPHKGDLIEMEMNDNFPHESLNMISLNDENEPPWFANIANYLVGSVWIGRKLWIFSKLVTMVPSVDIMARPTLPRKFSTLVSSGPLYIVMPMTWSNIVTHVNVKEKSYKETKCPRTLSRFVRSLTCGHRLYELSTSYHPQTSGQVEVSNRGLKRILEWTMGEHRAKWADKLDDALWAFRTTFKTSISCTPYRLVYRTTCHLPIDLEHKAYWALKWTNFDLKTVDDHRKV
ncbi:reverse transcriptase domain-containing protein [Tanacetum coccineum]